MEKICLARRRVRGICSESEKSLERTEGVLSIGLESGQCRLIQSETGDGASECRPDRVSLDLLRGESGQMIFNFHFEKIDSIRLLKPEDVIQMLQIGKGALGGLVRSGELKCYRIGRARRFLLRDILDFLSKSGECEFPETAEDAAHGSPYALPEDSADEEDRNPICEQKVQTGM